MPPVGSPVSCPSVLLPLDTNPPGPNRWDTQAEARTGTPSLQPSQGPLVLPLCDVDCTATARRSSVFVDASVRKLHGRNDLSKDGVELAETRRWRRQDYVPQAGFPRDRVQINYLIRLLMRRSLGSHPR